jgi:hypothetical protein
MTIFRGTSISIVLFVITSTFNYSHAQQSAPEPLPAAAQNEKGGGTNERLLVGYVKPYRAESPHPYGKAAGDEPVWTDKVVSSGATFLRIQFDDFNLAPGDFVLVTTPDRSVSWKYEGNGPRRSGKLWSFAVPGDTALVEIHAPTGGGYGYRIVNVGHGTGRYPGKTGSTQPPQSRTGSPELYPHVR